jgi:hypothetical protein
MSKANEVAALVEHIARHHRLGLQKVQFRDVTELVEVSTRRDRILVSLPGFVAAESCSELYGQQVIIQLAEGGREFILPGVIDKAIRIKPGSETGRSLGLKSPSLYWNKLKQKMQKAILSVLYMHLHQRKTF